MSRMPSESHPLRVDEVAAGAGTIGITLCPGNQDSHWKRNLGLDLAAIVGWHPSAMLTLIEDHEFTQLNVCDLGDRVREAGIDWYHLPIADVRTPDGRFESRWSALGPTLGESLQQGGRILVHCRGGLGRAGTVAALLLVELGIPATSAIAQVRAARPGAIETPMQRQYVLDHVAHGRSP